MNCEKSATNTYAIARERAKQAAAAVTINVLLTRAILHIRERRKLKLQQDRNRFMNHLKGTREWVTCEILMKISTRFKQYEMKCKREFGMDFETCRV
jgi:hypothetical protein